MWRQLPIQARYNPLTPSVPFNRALLVRPQTLITSSLQRSVARSFSSSDPNYHNPLGLPRSNQRPAPTIPTRGGPIVKRGIPHVKQVIAVASGKGGVGKSTVALNLALALGRLDSAPDKRPLRVGLLDLDVFGPSVPKLMGLEGLEQPDLTADGRIVPLANHGLQCMSMGFLIPNTAANSNGDTAVVWRGLMVQKAAQQLLFDVDWRGREGEGHPGLDILVIDMPPGTGDVQLTLGQLVKVDGAVIVSTPQDVALIDARKGVNMFQKVDVPILGLLLNMSHFRCSSCEAPHFIFGSHASFDKAAKDLSLEVLGRIPLVPAISAGGDSGKPLLLSDSHSVEHRHASAEVKAEMTNVAQRVLDKITPSRT